MKNSKKILCVFLTLLLLWAVLAPTASAEREGGAVPIVHVAGRTGQLLDGNGKVVYPYTIPDGYIADAVAACMPLFLEAYATGNTDEYAQALYSYVFPIFAEMQLDKDGNSINGVYAPWSWSRETLTDKARNGVYGLYDYAFYYDWRIDPCENADILNRYIEDVKAVTGADKVNLVGRCEGACIAMAYLAEYGHDDIHKIMFNCSAAKGHDDPSNIFCGKIYFDVDAVDRYGQWRLQLDDEFLSELVFSTLYVMKATYGLDITARFLESAYERVIKKLLPDLVLGTYGAMPGIFAMVSVDDFDDAMRFLFTGREEQYPVLIEKLNHYHQTVRLPMDSILTAAIADGVEVGGVTKYGYQNTPVLEIRNEVSDGGTLLRYSSFGSTSPPMGKPFSDAYLQAARDKGLDRYISDDRMVDASTCLFRDTMWIVKGVEHRIFPAGLESIILEFFYATDGFDVNSSSRYPQFMIYDEKTGEILPMTPENSDFDSWEEAPGFFDAIINFWKALFNYIKNYFAALFAG